MEFEKEYKREKIEKMRKEEEMNNQINEKKNSKMIDDLLNEKDDFHKKMNGNGNLNNNLNVNPKKDSFSLMNQSDKVSIKKKPEESKEKPKKLIVDKENLNPIGYNLIENDKEKKNKNEFSLLSNNNDDGLFDKVLNQVKSKNKGR